MILKFGRHKGKDIINVPDEYLLWLSQQDNLEEGLREYFEKNIKAIEANVERNKKMYKQEYRRFN